MGVSVYYSLARERPLTPDEAHALNTAFDEAALPSGTEPLAFYDEPETVVSTDNWELSGSSKLPSNLFTAPRAVKKLLRGLSAARRAVPDADWSVQLDDEPVAWNTETTEYDLNPSR
ncbi:hypothetical protein [Microbacterium sp. LWH10-1.2]|uniref:hypothetical protein n=1 Tax=Microbacterium sp. LWH10-1.2 TaxID=3135255 RepID=UPI0031399B3F